MQITIPQSTLARELALVAGAVEKRSTIPILSNIRVDAGPDGITLTATDLQQALVTRVPCDVAAVGSLCIPGARLAALVKMLAGDVTITTSESNYATVTAGRSRSRIAGMSVESWPELPAAPDPVFSLDARALSRTFGRVAFAITTEESRFTLNGALLEVSGSQVRAVATDGHRLALAEIDGATCVTPLKVLIPRAAIAHFAKLADNAEGGARVDVSADENHLFFAVGPRLLVARKLTGNFPDYSRILPKEDKYVTVDREELKSAIVRVAQFADERSKSARFAFFDGELKISASSTECGESEESIPCEGSANVEMGFNASYIVDGLGAISHAKVAVYLKDAKSAAELRSMAGAGTAEDPYRPATDGRVIIMPMRL